LLVAGITAAKPPKFKTFNTVTPYDGRVAAMKARRPGVFVVCHPDTDDNRFTAFDLFKYLVKPAKYLG
jgi:hypothetical protein